MLALMCHLLYLRSRLGQVSLVGLNVLPQYIEEQFTRCVAFGTPGSIVSQWLHCQEGCYGKHKGLVIGRYGSGTCWGSKSERAAKGMEITPVHLLYLENFVRLKSQSLDFARKIYPLFLRQVGMQLE